MAPTERMAESILSEVFIVGELSADKNLFLTIGKNFKSK
jgi:hypothetical protein